MSRAVDFNLTYAQLGLKNKIKNKIPELKENLWIHIF